MKTTVIYHAADFDGIFCREIARKFLPNAELIGWDYGNPLIQFPPEGEVYLLDLSPSCFSDFGGKGIFNRFTWIDHHKSAIEEYDVAVDEFLKRISGYRIDGVAACRLAWQWFATHHSGADRFDVPGFELPNKHEFVERMVKEPLAVRLAGEYDIWDKRDPRADVFQFGLRSEPLDEYWPTLLDQDSDGRYRGFHIITRLLGNGELLQRYQNEQNASVIKDIGFTFKWEGLTWLACNHARYNSHLFTSALRPEHDACFGFKFTGHCAAGASCEDWSISLYHAPGKEHHDLSKIAVKHGGGGHRGACGFRTNRLPFL